jgi:hypothetical protein
MLKLAFSGVIFTSLFASFSHANPPPASALEWAGQIKIWTADLCFEPECASLPQPTGVQWPVKLVVKDENSAGYHVIGREVFVNGPWSVIVLVTRMNPTDGKPAYIATQTTLKEAKFGVVAQCARYDAVGAFTFLPPGSCSGQMNGKLIGVSLYSPSAGL